MARKPNLNPVLSAIKDGKFDEQLDQITKVVEARKDILKKQLEKEVKKLWGKDFEVSNKIPPRKLISPVDYGQPDRDELLASDQVVKVQDDKEEDFDEDDKGYVSRSPIIGPLPEGGPPLLEEE